jgi:hypothetical protein
LPVCKLLKVNSLTFDFYKVLSILEATCFTDETSDTM